MSERHDPKLFEMIRLAVLSLPGYGLICNDRNNPMLSRIEVIKAIDIMQYLHRQGFIAKEQK